MTHTFTMRYMRLEDIPQVVNIDRVSFPLSWSARTYQFEITNRETSHMLTLEASNLTPNPTRGFRGMLQRLVAPRPPAVVVGYGGCWLIAGEAHISTIAVHPDFRGQGLGELVLAGMLNRAIELGGQYSVLEVRASNMTAQRLYVKYEYEIVGRRKGYYRDNSEDALLMEIRPMDDAYQQRLQQRLAVLSTQIQFVNLFK